MGTLKKMTLVKGSAEAKRWGEKMRKARMGTKSAKPAKPAKKRKCGCGCKS